MNWKNKDDSYKTGEYSLTPSEYEKLFSNCNTLFERILLEVGIATGCRRADLAAIEKSNIDLTNMTISYIEKKKGGRIKTINFGNKLKTDLTQYIFTLPSKCKWLFPSPHGKENHISDRTIWNVFNQVCARCWNKSTSMPCHAFNICKASNFKRMDNEPN